MNIKSILFFSILIGSILFTSCTSSKKVVYLQNQIEDSKSNSYETILQPDDALMIVITSENPEVAAPYNLMRVTVTSTNQNDANGQLISYIIKKDGTVDFPLIGVIKLGGLTKSEAVLAIKESLKEHVKDAYVTLEILNYKVSVLGEVQKPGTYKISSERITLLEALSLAGDLTIYGKRKNILIVREKEGIKTMERIDITNSNFINSPFYYLSQNDVVYVEPNKTKINSSVVGPNLSVALTAISLLVTILAITIR
jgi:polysaccharide export outer membrane protein